MARAAGYRHTHTVRTKLSELLEDSQGASLLVQWLGRSPKIGARVQSLVREPDPTCCSELSTLNTYFKIKNYTLKIVRFILHELFLN